MARLTFGNRRGAAVGRLTCRQRLLSRGSAVGVDRDGVEDVAGAAHGAHGIGFVAAHDRFAQPADMHIDGTFIDLRGAAPDAVEQLRPAQNPAGIFHEQLEQAVFRRPEIDLAAEARDAVRGTVDS